MVVKITVANPSGATSATHESMAFPIQEGAYQTGLTVDGVPYIVAPNGVKLNDPSPVRTSTGRGARHGSQVNPVVTKTFSDGIKTALDSYNRYDAALLHDFATVIQPNDAFLKMEGIDTITNARDGVPLKWRGVHVVSSAPPANAFAAPFLWPAADKASRPWRTVDIAARLSELPSYSAAGQSVTPWADVQPYLDRFDLGRAFAQDTDNGYQEFTTYLSSPLNPNNNYGPGLANVQAQHLTGLMSAGWSSGDKEAAFIRLLQQGCQWGEAMVKAAAGTEADGGHELAIYAPAMAWLWATGRQDQYATWMSYVAGNILSQYYAVTTSMISNDFVPHTDPLKPYPYRERSVIAITNAGLTVEMTGYRASGNNEDTNSSLNLAEMRLTKKVGGADAYIVSSSQVGGPPGTVIVNLSAPVAGLAVSDVVYCKANYTLTNGMPEWRIRNQLNLSVPSPAARYNQANHPTAARMFVRAIGMAGADVAIGEAFMERANAGTDGYRDQVDSSIIGAADPPWVRQFYDANWTTLKALPQSV